MRLFVVCLVALAASVACRNSAEPSVEPEVGSPARWVNLSKVCSENSPAYSLPAELRATIDTFPLTGSLARDAFIARTNPGGWGGRAFRDADQYYMYFMYFVDTTRTADIFATLRQRGILVPDDLELRKGRWDFAQIYDWSAYLSPTKLAKVDFHVSYYMYIDVPLNRIEFVAASEADRVKLDSILSALDIPCFLAAIAIEPPGPPRGL